MLLGCEGTQLSLEFENNASRYAIKFKQQYYRFIWLLRPFFVGTFFHLLCFLSLPRPSLFITLSLACSPSLSPPSLSLDIKPSNMLINTQGHVKLCDFGVSVQLLTSLTKTFIGTNAYMAVSQSTN